MPGPRGPKCGPTGLVTPGSGVPVAGGAGDAVWELPEQLGPSAIRTWRAES